MCVDCDRIHIETMCNDTSIIELCANYLIAEHHRDLTHEAYCIRHVLRAKQRSGTLKVNSVELRLVFVR